MNEFDVMPRQKPPKYELLLLFLVRKNKNTGKLFLEYKGKFIYI